MKAVRPRNKPLLEPLENRLLCRLSANGEFAIAPPRRWRGLLGQAPQRPQDNFGE